MVAWPSFIVHTISLAQSKEILFAGLENYKVRVGILVATAYKGASVQAHTLQGACVWIQARHIKFFIGKGS